MDGCESFSIECQSTWSSEGVRHNILSNNEIQQIDLQLLNTTDNPGEVHYTFTVYTGEGII